MRMTISLPDQLAKRFQAIVSPRQRSRMLAALLAQELKKKEEALEAACLSANRDRLLEKEIDEWQTFENGFAE
ncbi:MAG: hypothetical protein HY879_25050 [Deltaproteobacteria bacterium]|nr:hypothetical protein [Deltaproteobacteria bacterium]